MSDEKNLLENFDAASGNAQESAPDECPVMDTEHSHDGEGNISLPDGPDLPTEKPDQTGLLKAFAAARAFLAGNVSAAREKAAPLWNKIHSACFSTGEKRRLTIIIGVTALVVLSTLLWVISRGVGGREEPVVINASIGDSGVINIRGLERFDVNQIQERLSFEPETRFIVAGKGPDGSVDIMLENYRNIPYKGIFSVDGKKGEEDYEVLFFLNEPGLSVRIGNTGSTVEKYSSLELIFSEQVDIYSLQENMTIEPRTAYSLSYNLNRVTIAPNVEWITTDNYRIMIDADYQSANGKQFTDNQVLSFRAKAAPVRAPVTYTPRVDFHSSSNFLLDESKSMSLTFSAEHLRRDVPVVVETYRMESLEKYKTQGHIYLNYDIKMDSLEKLDTNAFLIEHGDNRFEVPNFGEGAYILAAMYKDPANGLEKQVRTSYLVTPVSVYMQASVRETLIWLNSSKQSAPLAGYTVKFERENEGEGVTDESGALVIPHKDAGTEYSREAFSVYDPDGKLVYYDNAGLGKDIGSNQRFYSYMFLDRTLYKPEDTVCFWGFVKPFRYNEKPLPETVTVRFDAGGLDIAQEVPIEESGVFYGEIPLERVKSTQYSVQAELYYPPEKENEEGTRYAIETEYVSVKEFEKPTFVLTSEYDKEYYGPNDMVNVTVTASFYDGTPLPHYPIEVSYGTGYGSRDWGQLNDIKTDTSGHASFSFPANPGGKNIDSVKSLMSNRYKVQIASDGEQITHVNGYRYFPSDILVETSIQNKGTENLEMTVRAYKLNMDSYVLKSYMSTLGGDYWRLDNTQLLKLAKGDPADANLKIALNWNYTDKNNIIHENRDRSSSGSYIEFDNYYSLDHDKSRGEQFEIIEDWETREKLISVNTKGGVAVIRDLIYKTDKSVIDFDKPVYCRAEVKYADGLENKCSAYEYYPGYDRWNSQYYREDDSEEDKIIKGYSFAVTELSSGSDITPGSYYYDGVTMNAGEQARFQLLLDSAPVETSGRILYTIIQDGLCEYNITNNDSFDLQYKLDYGRNVRMAAVYFDGVKAHYIRQFDLSASSESLGVSIEVTPDKESYRPGESVGLTVRATDYLGRGVAGNMCVAVVDESIFALSEQYVDVFYSLYDSLYLNNYVSQYCTTYRDEPYFEEGMRDGGKGGDEGAEFYDSYRSNFKDTALFLPTSTDASGNGHIQFTLPDNTTSWRITAVEIGKDLRAGQSKSNIISSLPFFVKPVLTSKYIDGDDIAMLVQGHGTLLKEGSEINYTVTMRGDGFNATLTGKGKAYQAMEFNFGRLPVGSYTVVARAQYSGYADTVELPVNILKSNLELVVNKSVDITQKLDISAMRYPVTLTLYDKENEAFIASINSLFGHYCMQANQRLSRFVAKRVIRQTVEDGIDIPYYIAEGNEYASDMQNDDGGIGYYPGAPSDPIVTTYVLLVAKDQFNLRTMSEYYRGTLRTNTDPKTRAACYLGLAAIGDMTSTELLMLIDNGSFRYDGQAYLIAGLAYLGEAEKAAALYEQKLAPIIGQLKDGVKKDVDFERDAAAIWIAASKLNHPDADKLSLYFARARWRYRTLFECMIYVTNYDRLVKNINFSYTLNGVTKNVNLGLSGMHTLTLSKSSLESLRFTRFPESLRATAYYVGEPSEIGIMQSPNMSIDKTITPVDDNTYEVALSIHLKKGAPTGQYDISDWVPSNTRLYSYDRSYGVNDNTVRFKTTSEGQKLYIAFDNNLEADRVILYRYRVRQTFDGEAVLDTTYMIHGDSGENCNTEKESFKPSPARDAVSVINFAK